MDRIPSISENVASPVVLAPAGMAILRQGLAACGYTRENCARRLGVFPRLGVNFWPALRRKWMPDERDAVDILLRLLIDGEDINADHLKQFTSAAFVDAMVASGLTQLEGETLRSRLCLFPCYGKYIVTDRACKNTAMNQVMWLWGESFILGGLVPRMQRERAIDVGSGSGVHAILAASHCREVLGVDINPRAIEFGRFNAALNGASNVEFALSDLFAMVEGDCDLMLANPPYIPDCTAPAGENFWSGGEQGTAILRRIVEAIPERLAETGTAHVIALYPLQPGRLLKDEFDRWLGGAIGGYQVLDHTWPVPNYQDVLSEKPIDGDKSSWRFGVISLRRTNNGSGWWKQVGGSGLFFNSDGSCRVVADHDTV